MALFHIPIANSNTILQVVPLMVTAAAAIFLQDEVGWRRWTAIAVGFAGVLIVIRPGLAGFNEFSLLALAAAAFIALRDMTTRIMPRSVPTLVIAFITAAVVGTSGPIYGRGRRRALAHAVRRRRWLCIAAPAYSSSAAI